MAISHIGFVPEDGCYRIYFVNRRPSGLEISAVRRNLQHLSWAISPPQPAITRLGGVMSFSLLPNVEPDDALPKVVQALEVQARFTILILNLCFLRYDCKSHEVTHIEPVFAPGLGMREWKAKKLNDELAKHLKRIGLPYNLPVGGDQIPRMVRSAIGLACMGQGAFLQSLHIEAQPFTICPYCSGELRAG